MRLFLVGTRTSSDRIDTLHYHMFHGHAERPSVRFPNDPAHNVGEDLGEALRLSRNGRIVPQVFQPRSSMIVSEPIAQRLARFQNAVLIPVLFDKLVDYDFTAGDFSFYDQSAFRRNPMRNDPATLIQRLPDIPELHSRIGSFFELVIARIDQSSVKPRDDKSRRPVGFQIEYLGSLKAVTLKLSPLLLQLYPMMWAEGCILFVEAAFADIKRHLDLDYFFVAESVTPW
jgi:hypothetical protein